MFLKSCLLNIKIIYLLILLNLTLIKGAFNLNSWCVPCKDFGGMFCVDGRESRCNDFNLTGDTSGDDCPSLMWKCKGENPREFRGYYASNFQNAWCTKCIINPTNGKCCRGCEHLGPMCE